MVLNITKPNSLVPRFALGPAPILKGTFAEQRSAAALAEDFPEFAALKTREEKRDWVEARHRGWLKEITDLEKKRERSQSRLAELKKASDACDDIIKWMEAGLTMERPDSLLFPSLRKAMAAGDFVTFPGDHQNADFAFGLEKEVFRHAELFAVEHDWARALDASDLHGAPFKLPYDVCAFELKASGRPLIALATQFETDVLFSPCIKTDSAWVVCAGTYSASRESKKATDLCDVIAPQIRAICIALEAKVARADITRVPYSGQTGNSSGALSRPYHVVSLVRRSARAMATGNSSDRKVRLHFRRGHWRHFEKHRTWINWMLVGDPDLGFVDKHYKL